MMKLLAILLLAAPAPQSEVDPRTQYDVQAYHLDLRVDPEQKQLSGTVRVEAIAGEDGLEILVLDLYDEWRVSGFRLDGAELDFRHRNRRLRAELEAPLAAGAAFAVEVDYAGEPRSFSGFSGFHWARTKAGEPWINTSCQGPGAHSWWPCKANFFHADDKPERVSMDLTVPEGLVGVSNGRLLGTESPEPGWTTYRWRHDYPLETYTVTLNAAPYVVVEDRLSGLPGHEQPVPFLYYVLPENADKAAVQFRQVPELMRIYCEAFGPYPFPESKLALVETNFWGMEHSTAIAYGSSYPAWCAENGVRDPMASRNRWFDYILVHELAHEWWGNGVSATDWGHFWIHEGFGTYAEGVYVERTQGRAAADRFFAEMGEGVGKRSRLYRGEDVDSGEAYAGVIYTKGATVLHTLRHFVDDDEAWWAAVKDFNLRFRYRNADTEDFRAVLEEHTGRSWERFFRQWVYGQGYPMLRGRVAADGRKIRIELRNDGSAKTGFHVPLDLEWTEDGQPQRKRLMVPPGSFRKEFPVGAAPKGLRVVGLERVLGRHRIKHG